METKLSSKKYIANQTDSMLRGEKKSEKGEETTVEETRNEAFC
jgi:hypothetical protein